MEQDRFGAVDRLALVAGGAFATALVVVWSGAALALGVRGQPVPSLDDAGEAAARLPENASDPAAAWPAPVADQLPGPVAYWACTLIAAVVAAGLAAAATRLLAGPRVGMARRRPLGVDARPRWATARDLAPVLVHRATAGRFVVARFGRRLVATEDAGHTSLARRGRHRRGDRGAVALVGPSRSGKTTAAISGILDWAGPAVLSSVKADLLGATIGWRSRAGDVRVYDPTRTLTGLEAEQVARASWSPVGQAVTVAGAQRAARALCEAAPRGGVEGGMDFWLAQAEILLSGLLYVAHHTGRDMGRLAEWVLLQDRPREVGPDELDPGEVRTCLDVVLSSDDDDVVAGAIEASRGLLAIWEMEDRTRSSVYATAQTVVWPWAEPEVAVSARGHPVDLEWVLDGANTVYLCAPIEDQRRLQPAFGGLLNDLVAQAYRRVAATGRPLDPPLLLVVDEAGNTPMRSLPEYASTLAGIGVLLVTIWQSLAQIESAYGRDADTILTNHLTKVFYAGLSDPASLRYAREVLGDTEVETRSRSTGDEPGRGSVQHSGTNVALAPAHVLRQMRPGDALLLHGTLPPAHVRTRPYYRDRHLARKAELRPAKPTVTAGDDALAGQGPERAAGG